MLVSKATGSAVILAGAISILLASTSSLSIVQMSFCLQVFALSLLLIEPISVPVLSLNYLVCVTPLSLVGPEIC